MTVSDIPDLICAEDLPASGDCIELASAEVIASAITEASYLIFRMSGGRVFGVRDATVRPVLSQSGCWADPVPVTLVAPVQRVRWVMIDGSVLTPSAYRLMDNNKLLRIDGEAWPACQDLTRTLSETNTFAVRYSFGSPVDELTRRAVADTAAELIKMTQPDTTSRRMPPNVRSSNASGVSLSMQDRNQLIRELGSYLESVNRFMAVHNPHTELETFVYSPDTTSRLHALDGIG